MIKLGSKANLIANREKREHAFFFFLMISPSQAATKVALKYLLVDLDIPCSDDQHFIPLADLWNKMSSRGWRSFNIDRKDRMIENRKIVPNVNSRLRATLPNLVKVIIHLNYAADLVDWHKKSGFTNSVSDVIRFEYVEIAESVRDQP